MKHLTIKLLISLALFLPTVSFGQNTDTIQVSDSIFGSIIVVCKNERERIHFGRQLTREDSLNNCTETKTYLTNHKEIYYLKMFNLYGQLRAEGFAKAMWFDRKVLWIKIRPKHFTIVRNGRWMFYDNNGNKTSDCCYKNDKMCSGCKWTNYDKEGNIISEYFIDN